MKTLLRNVDGLYFQGPDRWTPDPAEALNFRMIDRALGFISRCNLQNVELAFAFDDLSHVTCVPVQKLALNFA